MSRRLHGMCQFVVLFAVLCCAHVDVLAVSSEVCDEAVIAVKINTIKKNGDRLCDGKWDVTSLKTESGVPLLQAIADLEKGAVWQKPFRSDILDNAMKALVEDIKNDDKREDPNKKYPFLHAGMRYLAPQGGWFWCFLDPYPQRCPFVLGFTFGAVRLTFERRPIEGKMRPQRVLLEGFPAQVDYGMMTPDGWDKTPDWWVELPDLWKENSEWECDRPD